MLAERLGLPPDLSSVMTEAIAELVEDGSLSVDVEQVALTAAGRERLNSRLSDLGLR